MTALTKECPCGGRKLTPACFICGGSGEIVVLCRVCDKPASGRSAIGTPYCAEHMTDIVEF
jgi:hypothetical protein